MKGKERIILALDVGHFEEAQRIVLEFKDYVGMFKVGSQLFTRCGPKIVEFIKLKGSKVFLDLKFHDIPNTVKNACLEALRLKVDMMNVHALGGFTMMREAQLALSKEANQLNIEKPRLIAVTVLTSIDEHELKRMGIETSLSRLTEILTLLSKEAGLDGVVAGGEEIERVRKISGDDFIIVTPGIRINRGKDDQKRVLTPKEAFEKGANYIVLGRTILEDERPKGLLEEIIKGTS